LLEEERNARGDAPIANVGDPGGALLGSPSFPPLRRRGRSTFRLLRPAPRGQPADQVPQRRQGVVVLVLGDSAIGRCVRVAVKFRFVQEPRDASHRILSPPVSIRPETQAIPGRSSLFPRRTVNPAF